jgi:hypothetical protein
MPLQLSATMALSACSRRKKRPVNIINNGSSSTLQMIELKCLKVLQNIETIFYDSMLPKVCTPFAHFSYISKNSFFTFIEN